MDPMQVHPLTAGGAITLLIAAVVYLFRVYRGDVRELIDKFEASNEKRDAVLEKMAVSMDHLSDRVDRMERTVSGCPVQHGS